MKRARQVKSDLAALTNVGPTIERRLNAIGIYSREDLLRIGPAQAYLNMQAQASGALPVCFYLYSLEGALINRHWNDLPAATKALLLKSVDRG
jgi:DNA transformation protein and related proteins